MWDDACASRPNKKKKRGIVTKLTVMMVTDSAGIFYKLVVSSMMITDGLFNDDHWQCLQWWSLTLQVSLTSWWSLQWWSLTLQVSSTKQMVVMVTDSAGVFTYTFHTGNSVCVRSSHVTLQVASLIHFTLATVCVFDDFMYSVCVWGDACVQNK